jgi:hypothetical protein
MPNGGTILEPDLTPQKSDPKPTRKKEQDTGFIYFLRHPDMPGKYKIGMTSKEPDIRIAALNDTNVPGPFVCLYAGKTKNHRHVERILHKILIHYKIDKKEFFELPEDMIAPVQELINLLCFKDVTESVQKQTKTPTQPQLNFGNSPIYKVVTDINKIPPGYDTYPNLKPILTKYPLAHEEDFNDWLFAFRVAVRHRINKVPYYKLKGVNYYDPKTFEEQIKREEDSKKSRQENQP